MTKEELRALVEQHLGDWSGASGAVLFSDLSSIRTGSVYLLGYNPGETPDPGAPGTRIIENLCAPDGTNNFADQWWGKGEASDAALDSAGRLRPEYRTPLQACVTSLIGRIGGESTSVLSTNLIFARSAVAAELENRTGWRSRCWPVHRALLSIVQPSVIIAVGIGDTFEGVRSWGKELGPQQPIGTMQPPLAWTRRLQLELLDRSTDVDVIGVLHPSDRTGRGAELRSLRTYPGEILDYVAESLQR